MKISVYNFKSVRKLVDFELKPFTILSGINSSGKSSAIQILLLLKQTLDGNKQLNLRGDLYKISAFTDILFNKNSVNQLKVNFQFSKKEFLQLPKPKFINVFKSLSDYRCDVEIEFDNYDEEVFVSLFGITVTPPPTESRAHKIEFITRKEKDWKYSIRANTGIFNEDLLAKDPPSISQIAFNSLYPNYYEIRAGDATSRKIPKLDDFIDIVNLFFKNISYIGPLRDEPKDEYVIPNDHESVGVKGENVAKILETFSMEPTHYHKIVNQEDCIIYKKDKTSLLKAVKYWVCDVFGLAQDIKPEKVDENYRIVLINESGITTTIKHVGFGVSQLLPIIVEGLRMSDQGLLILEQPEIHLHPKLQSLLFDFLYSLTLQGKHILVETHSDHLITRMRRRIAEDPGNSMSDRINLTFIELHKKENIFRTLDLDEFGTLDYFPEDFVERSDVEFRAIVKAQMKKRIQENSQ